MERGIENKFENSRTSSNKLRVNDRHIIANVLFMSKYGSRIQEGHFGGLLESFCIIFLILFYINILQMLQRLTRSLWTSGRYFYSAPDKQNKIVVPKNYQIPLKISGHLLEHIQYAKSCRILSALIKENLEHFSDRHITAVFKHIGYYDLPDDQSFHTVIAPIAVEWIKNFNREQAPTLLSILLTLTARNISSPDLEQAVVKKLDGEDIYRYLNLLQTVDLFHSLAKQQRFLNTPLFNKLQNVIYQQKAYYSQHPNQLKLIREGLDAVEANSSGEKPLEINAAYKQIS